MVYTLQYLEISTFQMKTVVYWKNQTINTFKASESKRVDCNKTSSSYFEPSKYYGKNDHFLKFLGYIGPFLAILSGI